jgi:hypothetical protein
MKGKLAPRYIGFLKSSKKIGQIAYKLKLPPHITKIHDIFNVSLFWKAKVNPFGLLP